MKKILYIFLVLTIMTSCYDEEYFIDDNTTTNGDHYPVIQSLVVEGEMVSGNSLNLIMHYWSLDAIDHFELYSTEPEQDEALVASIPYQYSYDEETESEVITISYEIPTVSSGAEIDLRVLVINENGLERETTTSITIE
ncbi:hypothetical protein LVD15_13915 [Fulvivirga maritima]|uniref:hypothetical protein n=1 Tax=Fulvivirga maritima TaxID=2904247 RepID=UPI001F3F654F|nr:hypothetical protein [Fulvivirga maritima]UII24418.1 hypothetical protein LVD15_13915 [Fulvivirga maritima]